MTVRAQLAAGLCLAIAAVAVPLASAARPSVSVPANMTVEAQSYAGSPVTFSASATLRGDPVPVSCAPPSGSTFPLGQTVVSCRARDPEDDEDSRTERFSITVVDTTPPVIRIPTAPAARTTSRSGAKVSWTTTANDIVDGPLVPACTPSSGTRFPVGETQVVCRASDRRGNVTSGTFFVTVSLVRAAAKRSALITPALGATVTAPPLLRWRTVQGARFYNVQLHRGGRKLLTIWPTRPRYRLRRTWSYQGRRFRLRPGVYRWYVWPAFGTLASPRYGRLLGESSFRVR